MDEVLNNQVTDTVGDTYIKDINNKYTVLLGVMFQDLQKNHNYWYRKITTADLETNNLQLNNIIDSSLRIDKYFEWVDNSI